MQMVKEIEDEFGFAKRFPWINFFISHSILDIGNLDSFTRCFKLNPPEPWNWNIYLFSLWCCGVVVIYCLLFPLRCFTLAFGWFIFLSSFIPVHSLLKGDDRLRKKIEKLWVMDLIEDKGLKAVASSCKELREIVPALITIARNRPNFKCFRLVVMEPFAPDYKTHKPLDEGFNIITINKIHLSL